MAARPPGARSGALALIVPWEFGAIPRDWVAPLQANVDELWVPSEHVRRMYLDAGIDPERVTVIPNGVDLEVFRPAPEPPESRSAEQARAAIPVRRRSDLAQGS